NNPSVTSTSSGAAELAARLRAGDLRSIDVVRQCLDDLAVLRERTNCVAAFDTERAQREALLRDEELDRGEVRGPLHGVPITVKDWIDVAGLPCTGGWVQAADRQPSHDATVVARLRAAGAIVVAKTTVQPESELFGVVRNPHDLTRSPGGSSS